MRRGNLMLYALICTDKPDSLAAPQGEPPRASRISREPRRDARVCRPLHRGRRRDHERQPVVVEAASLEAARKIAAGDPFAKAGLFASVDIRPWLWTINNPDEEE